ncbi:MAG: AarF/UbiB family protein [Pirellulales bacterium]|nr:AarF/UbiB family protein [Pirellulales bacterium]
MNWARLLDESGFAKLLPDEYAHFAAPVCEGLALFLEGLSEPHQAEILAQQATLSECAALSERLVVLARCCPVLQKIGQVLARDQRLAPELRLQLRQLESLPALVRLETIEEILHQEIGPLDEWGVRLTPPALAEASVAVVVPFHCKDGGEFRDGVFKVLKPGIEQRLEEELGLLEQVGARLDERCEELQIPHLDYQESFQQVRNKLQEEVYLDHEQRKLAAAREFYADEDRVLIPEVFEFCSSRVTAMEYVRGSKVTDHPHRKTKERNQLAEIIVDALIARPIFARQDRALFHSDPHAGNLFLTIDGRLAILDWSLVGWLEKRERIAIVQLLLAAVAHDPERMVGVLDKMAARGSVDRRKLQSIARTWLKQLRRGGLPGLGWLVSLLDESVRNARLRLKPDLMLFRKSLYTLEGVVAEVGAGRGTFDRVLWLEFLRHLAVEWPRRWFSLPNSREFATCLSNFDLTKTILGVPLSAARYWRAQCFDFWDACRTT